MTTVNNKTSKYSLFGKLKAKPGKADELQSILLQAAELISTAKGCHLYVISRNQAEETSVWVNEIWDSKQDHDNSLNIPACRELIGKAVPLLDGVPEKGIETEVTGGYGIKV